jgi:hypothetical protein
MRWITLGTSLSIAGVAAWYSIAGLMAIFAGAAIPIAIMGGALEVGKLVTASWLHNNWKGVEWWLRTYLVTAVVVLMLITSLGIFGFLSKAHLEHSVSVGGNNALQIQNMERRIANQQRVITDAESVLSQLDASVQTLIDYDRIRGKEGAIAVREAQREERNSLNSQIDNAIQSIEEIQETLAPLKQEQLSIEVEVGPLKYIAELIYGDTAKDMFDEAVRIVILLLIFVFDPLAVALLLVASRDFKDNKKSKMFYDDGNLRVDPNNVVAVDVEIERPEPVVEPIIEEVLEEVVIPDDEEESDYEVVVEESEDEGHGIILEDPTDPIRQKHEDGWYTQKHH